MRELFVYYRVRAADAVAARETAVAMQNGLRVAHPGLSARLLTRAGPADDLQTWMEIYSLRGEAEGVGPLLEAAIEAQAARWASLAAGPRHVEAFTATDD